MAWFSPRRIPGVLIPLAALVLPGCGGGSSSVDLPAGCQDVESPPPKSVDLKRPKIQIKRDEKLTASVNTSCGRFEVALDTARSPKTVNSFVYLARKGVYDDTTFHRIVSGFVVQGGSAQGTLSGGPGYSVDEPPPPNARYTKGTVAMAKAAIEPAGRSGSQFFVVVAADAGLPPQYAVLGHVSSGQDVVRRIASLGDPESGDRGTPRAPVVIDTISVNGR
jgi:peptidyl-prolyl cis-trans isomerase B (cyclophilin B)